MMRSHGKSQADLRRAFVDALFLRDETRMLRAVRELLEAGYDVNDGSDGTTPLLSCSRHGTPALAELLVQAGADLSARDRIGMNVLMHAARSGRTDQVEYYLSLGLPVDGGDRKGYTALYHALLTEFDNSATVRVLLEHGADPDLPMDGTTPRNAAEISRQMPMYGNDYRQLLPPDPRS